MFVPYLRKQEYGGNNYGLHSRTVKKCNFDAVSGLGIQSLPDGRDYKRITIWCGCFNLCRSEMQHNPDESDLSNADLRNANLREANLFRANLKDANLFGVNLKNANISYAKINANTKIDYPIACPETGSFIGYKKAGYEYIVKLQICGDAKRSSATAKKCRCSKALVLSIENIDGSDSGLQEIESDFDSRFVYRVGEIAEVFDFDDNRWDECAPGIHFFMDRQDAVEYEL